MTEKYFVSSFGEYPLSRFPEQLVKRLEEGTSYKNTLTCPTCGRGGTVIAEYTDDARAALEEMERICEEWWNRNE
jgi:hypothetical protein